MIQLKAPRWPGAALILCAGVTALLIALAYKPFIAPALERSVFSARASYADYYFLMKYAPDDEVILAARGYGRLVPAFGGKLVGLGTDLPFVPDAQARLEAVDLFFNENASAAERLGVIQKYDVKYVLLQKSRALHWAALRDFMKGYGSVVYQNNRFVLIEVTRTE